VSQGLFMVLAQIALLSQRSDMADIPEADRLGRTQRKTDLMQNRSAF